MALLAFVQAAPTGSGAAQAEAWSSPVISVLRFAVDMGYSSS
jgi:hypothetical protein